MCQVAVEIPNEVLYDTKMSKKDALDFSRKAVALCYYVQNGVSLGYCAKIANMSKEAFIKYLGQNCLMMRSCNKVRFSSTIRGRFSN